jgi:valyl-tRNA synthetase
MSAKKEAKRLEKEAKLAAKSAKTQSTPAGEKRTKVEKEKKAEDAPFVNTTPKGEKKGTHTLSQSRLFFLEKN